MNRLASGTSQHAKLDANAPTVMSLDAIDAAIARGMSDLEGERLEARFFGQVPAARRPQVESVSERS